MFAVTGITGNVGGEVARNLLAAGQPVRGVVRDISKGETWAKRGCDLVEAGVPYSDPGMDGPTIARATEAALHGGVRVRDTLAAVEAISLAGGRAVDRWTIAWHQSHLYRGDVRRSRARRPKQRAGGCRLSDRLDLHRIA